jgi:hypothetical protein
VSLLCGQFPIGAPFESAQLLNIYRLGREQTRAEPLKITHEGYPATGYGSALSFALRMGPVGAGRGGVGGRGKRRLSANDFNAAQLGRKINVQAGIGRLERRCYEGPTDL